MRNAVSSILNLTEQAEYERNSKKLKNKIKARYWTGTELATYSVACRRLARIATDPTRKEVLPRVGVRAGRVHLCRTAGKYVWSHMGGHCRSSVMEAHYY